MANTLHIWTGRRTITVSGELLAERDLARVSREQIDAGAVVKAVVQQCGWLATTSGSLPGTTERTICSTHECPASTRRGTRA